VFDGYSERVSDSEWKRQNIDIVAILAPKTLEKTRRDDLHVFRRERQHQFT
jgi:hypothetical protein